MAQTADGEVKTGGEFELELNTKLLGREWRLDPDEASGRPSIVLQDLPKSASATCEYGLHVGRNGAIPCGV